MTNLGQRLEGWHQRVARVMGAMALTLVRRGLTRGMLHAWGSELEAVGRDMRGAEKELNERAGVRQYDNGV